MMRSIEAQVSQVYNACRAHGELNPHQLNWANPGAVTCTAARPECLAQQALSSGQLSEVLQRGSCFPTEGHGGLWYRRGEWRWRNVHRRVYKGGCVEESACSSSAPLPTNPSALGGSACLARHLNRAVS